MATKGPYCFNISRSCGTSIKSKHYAGEKTHEYIIRLCKQGASRARWWLIRWVPISGPLGAWVQLIHTQVCKRFQTNGLELTLSCSGPGGRRFKSSLPDHSFLSPLQLFMLPFVFW